LNLYLDTSVIISACRSSTGAARLVCDAAGINQWRLLASPYGLAELERHLDAFTEEARSAWRALRMKIQVVEDIIVFDKPLVFLKTKDRPILLAAATWAEVLLTHDRSDFHRRLGRSFYELRIRTPSEFIDEMRAAAAFLTPQP